MYLRYGIIADSIVMGTMGKRNIIGAFSSIFSPTFPLIYPSISLVIQIDGDSSEGGIHDLELSFVNADYKALVPPIKGQFDLMKDMTPIDGLPLSTEIALDLQNIPIPGIGVYEFSIKVDGRHLGGIPLYVADKLPPS